MLRFVPHQQPTSGKQTQYPENAKMEIIVIGILVLIFSCFAFLHYRRMRSIALSRKDSDICRYARSFDYRDVGSVPKIRKPIPIGIK